MSDQRVFELTDSHIALIKRLNIKNDSDVDPLPWIDTKRPFGNSDILRDVMEVTGETPIKTADGEMVFTADAGDRARRVLAELATALSVIISAQSFDAGTYEVYGNGWPTQWRRCAQ